MNTLTTFEAVACTMGHTNHVLALHKRILEAEARHPSNWMACGFCPTNAQNPTAIAYRCSRQGAQTQLQTLLSKRDPWIDELDVCIYLATYDDIRGLCYYRGHVLGEGTPMAAFEYFRAHCAKFGVSADDWLALLRSKRL